MSAPIAVIGLGYVGLPLAVEFGRIRPVIGFDIDAARIGELAAGRDRTLEVTQAELTGADLRRYGRADHVLYDLKNVLPAGASDLRL